MNAAGAGVPQALIENHSALAIPCTEAAPVMAGATAGAEDSGAEDSVVGEFYFACPRACNTGAYWCWFFELVATDSKGVGAG